MASDPNLADNLIVSATWGSAVGVCVDYSWSYDKTYQAIPGEDSVYPDAQALRSVNKEAELSFLHGPLTCSDTAAPLVIVDRRVNGNTHPETLDNMICVSVTKSHNRDSSPAIYKQRFIGKGTQSQPS